MPLINNKFEPPNLAAKVGRCLFDNTKKWRYRVLYGGRGSSKSWGIADALIEIAIRRQVRILCCREIQMSIKDSVHRLLCDRIEALGYSGYFTTTDNQITSSGSMFIFRGLRSNVAELKSLEGIDYCWCAESQALSEESLDILFPTIRKEDSEIWFDLNPRYEEDAVYKRLITNKPDNCIIAKVNWSDNPWFPKVLQEEKDQDRVRDPLLYKCKWDGLPVGVGGKIWTMFDKQIHVREFPMDLVRDKGNCYQSIDPHSHYYPFCMWMAIIPKNERGKWPEDYFRWIYAEWPTFEDLNGYYHDMRHKLQYTGSLKEIATAIYNADGTGKFGIQIQKRFIDPRYAKGSGSWNWSSSTTGIIDLFAKPENGGLSFNLPNEKTLDAMRQDIHDDMLYNKLLARTIYNEPIFYIAPWCKNTIASFDNHRLIENSEREDEKYKEPSDCARILYAGLKDLKYKNPITNTTKVYKEPAYAGARVEDSWME